MSAPSLLVHELVPAPDPLETCTRFQGMPFLLFLDSATDPEHLGRYSFLAADPVTAVRSEGLLPPQPVAGGGGPGPGGPPAPRRGAPGAHPAPAGGGAP